MTLAIELPNQVVDFVDKILRKHNITLNESKHLAGCVKQLSDFYIKNPSAATPWHEAWCQVAYACYFLPLNVIRFKALWKRLQSQDEFKSQWQQMNQWVDFGAGFGNVFFGLGDQVREFKKSVLIEQSSYARGWLKELTTNGEIKVVQKHDSSTIVDHQTVITLSNSLTEIQNLELWMKDCGLVIIMEPSSFLDSRNLINVRQQLIEEGWRVLAPCTHQKACPMLQGQTDWCHDITGWMMPDWFKQIENHLPFKNQELTFSYLVATRNPLSEAKGLSDAIRVTGSRLDYKGYSKQLVCRSSDREFLSWQHKKFDRGRSVHNLSRGDLVKVDSELEKIAQEIRLMDQSSVEVVE